MHENGTLTLATIDGFGYSFKENGHRISLYHKLITRESFYQQIHEDSTIKILATEGTLQQHQFCKKLFLRLVNTIV